MVRQVRFLVSVEEIPDGRELPRRPGELRARTEETENREAPRSAPGARVAQGQDPVGRGIAAGKGKTAGRGTKGQKARAGGSIPPWFEGGQTPLHMRIPKLRGFTNPFKIDYEVVNVGDIARLGRARRVRVGEMPGRRSRQEGAPRRHVNQDDPPRRRARPDRSKKPLKILGGGELSVAAVRRGRRVHEVARRPRSRPPAGRSRVLEVTDRDDEGARRRRRSPPAARGAHGSRPARGRTRRPTPGPPVRWRRPSEPRRPPRPARRRRPSRRRLQGRQPPSQPRRADDEPQTVDAVAEADAARRRREPTQTADADAATTRDAADEPTSDAGDAEPQPPRPRQPRQTPPTTRTRSPCSNRC